MNATGGRNEVFLFCDSKKKHPGKRVPVTHFVKMMSGWMEKGPGGVLFRPGVEFVTSNGLRGRFSAQPGHSPYFRCPRCKFNVSAREEKLTRALDEVLDESSAGVSEISLSALSLKLDAVGE